MAMNTGQGGGGGRGGRGGGRYQHKPDASINVTPFVDVLLILLVVFMVVSSALPGLARTSNVVVIVTGSNQGYVFVSQSDSLLLEPPADFNGTRDQVLDYLLTNFSATDNFSFRGERAVLYTEVESWARTMLDAGYNNVKLRFRRAPLTGDLLQLLDG